MVHINVVIVTVFTFPNIIIKKKVITISSRESAYSDGKLNIQVMIE